MADPAPNPSEMTVHLLWINAGLSCDGDSVSLTAATLPSVEDIVMGAIPGLPKVVPHWPLVDYQVGDDFIQWFWRAAAGELDPFVLVVEGSIPNEAVKDDGYWAGFGNNAPGTSRFSDQPMKTTEWLDRLAPKATAVIAAGTCATYGGIHAMAGNPTGAMGVPDYLGWNWKSKAGLPVVCVPGCPIQPDNMAETLLYLLYQVSGQAPVIPLDENLRPTWLFGRTVHEGCDRAGYYEQGDFAHEYGSPKCIVKIGCWGPVVRCNVTKRGWMDGIGGCPNVGRHLHRLHDARFSRQVHALHGRAAWQQVVHRHQHGRRRSDAHAARHHGAHGRSGTKVAPQGQPARHRLRPAMERTVVGELVNG
jgi:hydrogenase small subunit